MKTKVVLLLFYIFSDFLFGQKTLNSPFSFSDYENMQIRFLDNLKTRRDDVVEIKDEFYSTKKLDSLLLIKDKFKRDKLLQEGVNEKDHPKYLKNLKDDVVLPFAYFWLYEKGMKYRVNTEHLNIIAERKNFSVRFAKGTGKPAKYYENITDKNLEMVTSKIYWENGSLEESRNNNTTYGFGIGESVIYSEEGTVVKRVNYDQGFEFKYEDLKKTYLSKVQKYWKMHQNEISGEVALFVDSKIKGNSKISNPRNYFRIEKGILGDKPVWKVIIGRVVFVFDGDNGEIINTTFVQYEG